MNKIPLVGIFVYIDSLIQITIKNKILKQILIIRPIVYVSYMVPILHWMWQKNKT